MSRRAAHADAGRTGPRRAVHALPGLLALSACATHFETVRAEFDSVAGFEPTEEPSTADYSSTPRRHPWTVRTLEGSGLDRVLIAMFGLEPEPTEVDNPSGFARERLRALAELALGDPLKTAEAAIRLQWVFFADDHVLNQIEALRGAVALLESFGVDPLDWPGELDMNAVGDRAVADFRVLEQRWRAAPADADREAYLAALQRLTARPLPLAIVARRGTAEGPGYLQRALIRTLLDYARREADPALIEPTIVALNRAVAHALTRTLAVAYVNPFESVKNAAVHETYRLSGPKAVAFSLAQLSQRDRGGGRSFERSEIVQRTLIRQCGQLRGDLIYETSSGGPAPIEYLYDRVKFSPRLHLVALEAMAQCLGRTVSWDADWADEWWQRYTLEGRPSDR